MRPALRFHAAMLATSLGLALVAPAGSAAKPPPSRTSSTVSARAPRIADPTGQLVVGAASDRFLLRILPDPAATGRGHSFTDAGLDQPTAPPTAHERVKLELARAAVEASRRAGTLFAPPREELRPALPALDPARKLARLRTQPVSLRPDAAVGLSPEHRPIQRVGPAGLNPIELAKLNGTLLPAPLANTPPLTDGVRTTGDGAPKPSDPPRMEDPRHD